MSFCSQVSLGCVEAFAATSDRSAEDLVPQPKTAIKSNTAAMTKYRLARYAANHSCLAGLFLMDSSHERARAAEVHGASTMEFLPPGCSEPSVFPVAIESGPAST